LQEEQTTDVGVIFTAASGQEGHGAVASVAGRTTTVGAYAPRAAAGARTFHRLDVLCNPYDAVRPRAKQPHLGTVNPVLACARGRSAARMR